MWSGYRLLWAALCTTRYLYSSRLQLTHMALCGCCCYMPGWPTTTAPAEPVDPNSYQHPFEYALKVTAARASSCMMPQQQDGLVQAVAAPRISLVPFEGSNVTCSKPGFRSGLCAKSAHCLTLLCCIARSSVTVLCCSTGITSRQQHADHR